jgi:hypothetical protein
LKVPQLFVNGLDAALPMLTLHKISTVISYIRSEIYAWRTIIK